MPNNPLTNRTARRLTSVIIFVIISVLCLGILGGRRWAQKQHEETRVLVRELIREESLYAQDVKKAGATLPEMVQSILELTKEIVSLRRAQSEMIVAQRETGREVAQLATAISSVQTKQKTLKAHMDSEIEEKVSIATTTVAPPLPAEKHFFSNCPKILGWFPGCP